MDWLNDLTDHPPVSFVYGGQSSGQFLSDWQHGLLKESHPAGPVYRMAWTDSATGLRVRASLRTFTDFLAVDCVFEFTNTGSQDTPILENILPLDLRLPMAATERCRLHHAKGSLCQIDDFLPQETDLGPRGRKVLTPQGGRSSNGVLPFMNLQMPDGGVILGIGWSGQWSASFERDKESLHITAGMEKTHLLLHPGETIRTPRILLMQWQGNDPSVGTNMLRQLLLKHYLPRVDGQVPTPPIAPCLQAYYYQTGQAGEQYEMATLPKAAALGADTYWIDACWYGRTGREWWQEVGSWVINQERFPNGLRPIADAAHKAGMKFLLWFEPERVREGSVLHQEHPEWLLPSSKDKDNFLLNFGLPEARQHITDLISGHIEQIGIDIYRQDFNFDPLTYWQAADAPDRIGMTEIQYVMGHYAFWDEILRRHPNLWIDNCASGGRRIDLETLSRSLPLWPSDFLDVVGLDHGMGLHTGDQCLSTGLARWVPLFGGGVWNFDPYSLRGGPRGGFTFQFHIPFEKYFQGDGPLRPDFKQVLASGLTLLGNEFPLEQIRQAIAECKSLRPFLLGDFYPLLPITASSHDWCAYQLHRPDLKAGFAVFLRRHHSPFPEMQANLRQIDPSAKYLVSASRSYEPQPERCMDGSDLAAMVMSIAEAPGSILLRYRAAE